MLPAIREPGRRKLNRTRRDCAGVARLPAEKQSADNVQFSYQAGRVSLLVHGAPRSRLPWSDGATPAPLRGPKDEGNGETRSWKKSGFQCVLRQAFEGANQLPRKHRAQSSSVAFFSHQTSGIDWSGRGFASMQAATEFGQRWTLRD